MKRALNKEDRKSLKKIKEALSGISEDLIFEIIVNETYYCLRNVRIGTADISVFANTVAIMSRYGGSLSASYSVNKEYYYAEYCLESLGLFWKDPYKKSEK